MFKIDGKLNGANLMTKYMGKETLEADMASCGLVTLIGRHADALKLEVDLEGMSRGSVLLLLTLSCLPKLASAADVGVALEPDDTNSLALVYYLVGLLVLIVGCCCCWAGAAIERRLGDRRTTTRSVGTTTEAAILPPPPPLATGGLSLTRRAPQSVRTTVRAGGLPGTGIFHIDMRCGGLSGADSLKTWRRCFRPECGGDIA